MSSASGSASAPRGRRAAGPVVAALALLAVLCAVAAAEPPAVRFAFQGNTVKSEAALRRAAAAELAAFQAKGLRPADLEDAAFRMASAYRRDGYAFAEVTAETAPAEGVSAAVTFRVEEGPRVLVEGVTVTGNAAVARSEIDALLAADPLTALAAPGRPFVAAEVEAAVQSIRDFYLGRGFLDVAVAPPLYRFHSGRSRVDIALHIAEGAPYRVRRTVFTGDPPAEAAEALDGLRRRTAGRPYTRRLDLAVQAQVLDILGEWGYPDAAVQVAGRTPNGPGPVDLDVEIAAGPRVTIADIRIEGAERTDPDFIRRRLVLRPGDRYHLGRQRESAAELFRSGLFSRSDLRLEPTADPERRILVVTVAEAPAQEVYLEPGWGSYEQLTAKLGYRHRNLFGSALSWSAGASASLKAQGASTTLTDLWFLDTKLRADLTGLADRREEPSFTRRDYGGSFFLSRELGPGFTLTGGYTLRNTRLSDLGSAAVEEEDLERRYDFSSLRLQAAYDTRDDLFFPTAGQRVFAGVEQADTWLGGEVNFTRFTLGARAYLRLAEATVLGLRGDGGFILPGRELLVPPPAERFFNGGENTVRSFKESRLGPRNGSGKPAGGLGFNVISAELRQRLAGQFTGSLFADLGNVSPNRTRFAEGEAAYRRRGQVVSDTLSDFWRGFRPAVGGGLQYQLPVGPVRLDVGFNPDREKSRDEDLYVVHFSIGMAF